MLKTEISKKLCRDCGKPTRHERGIRYANHTLHLLVSLVTFGLWVPIWVLLSVFPEKDRWRCSRCGCAHQPPREPMRWAETLLIVGVPAVFLLLFFYVCRFFSKVMAGF